jgi:hypothetical protein
MTTPSRHLPCTDSTAAVIYDPRKTTSPSTIHESNVDVYVKNDRVRPALVLTNKRVKT